ncbi:MAG: undecaprenyl-diphosphate phosphatase [Acholeplasma sp.]|nr:undecaprenyl-diphosphate phosphatase [Acholeplasma sp.]
MERIVELIKYMFLGVVQGITEILPVSSSGHLVLFQHIFDLRLPGLGFEMFTNMASLIALILFFRKDVWALVVGDFLYVFKKDQTQKPFFQYSLKLLIAVIPIGITGLLFKDYMEQYKTLLSVGIALMVTGVLLFTIYKKSVSDNGKEDITYLDALTIGLFQSVAILPGVSRSGSTLIGGLFRKISIKSLLKFSFLCYIIVSIPTSMLSLIDLSNAGESIDIVGYILAFVVTFVVTYATAKLVMQKLKTKHLLYFSIYVGTVGMLALISYLIF